MSLEKHLNDQLNREFFSAYAYLDMAAYFDAQGFKGFAAWMKAQSKEEMDHVQKFYAYINERGGSVALKGCAAPVRKWKTAEEVFKAALKHEKAITQNITDLVDEAIKAKDHAAHAFLTWFITEQVEEEAQLNDILFQFGMIGDSKVALLMLDKELGRRQ
ncbi:MAG: ferritin [Candidatus Margulisiibacteriota bacterium]